MKHLNDNSEELNDGDFSARKQFLFLSRALSQMFTKLRKLRSIFIIQKFPWTVELNNYRKTVVKFIKLNLTGK